MSEEAKDVLIVCRQCRRQRNFSDDPAGAEEFLKIFFSAGDWAVVKKEKLLPGTTISVPACPICFGGTLQDERGIIFFRSEEEKVKT